MVACYRVGGTECSSTCMGPFEGGHHYLHYLHHSLKVKVKPFRSVRLFAMPWTVAYQAPVSMGFSRQEYWSGLSFPFPGDLPNPGIKPASPTSEPPGKSLHHRLVPISREGTQLQPSTENWIGFTGHGPTPQNKTQFPPQSSIPSGTFHKPLVLLHQWQTD